MASEVTPTVTPTSSGTIWTFRCHCGIVHQYRQPMVSVDALNELRKNYYRLADWVEANCEGVQVQRDQGIVVT